MSLIKVTLRIRLLSVQWKDAFFFLSVYDYNEYLRRNIFSELSCITFGTHHCFRFTCLFAEEISSFIPSFHWPVKNGTRFPLLLFNLLIYLCLSCNWKFLCRICISSYICFVVHLVFAFLCMLNALTLFIPLVPVCHMCWCSSIYNKPTPFCNAILALQECKYFFFFCGQPDGQQTNNKRRSGGLLLFCHLFSLHYHD